MQHKYQELIVDKNLVLDKSARIKRMSNAQVLKDIFFSGQELEVYHVQMSNEDHLLDMKAQKQCNLFFESVRMAYQYHIPLTLSPEMLWVAIIQGFSIHINQNLDNFRKNIVDFDGQKMLVFQRHETNLQTFDWDQIFIDFRNLVQDNIGNTLHSKLTQNFSSSTPLFQTVQQIQLMDTTQNYYHYALVNGCGLPKVKLLGTLDDWVQLQKATIQLREFELDWWIDRLVPILDKLISEYNANKGDKVFWNTFLLLDKVEHHMALTWPMDGSPSFFPISKYLKIEEVTKTDLLDRTLFMVNHTIQKKIFSIKMHQILNTSHLEFHRLQYYSLIHQQESNLN